jgi:hypothetical protein
MQADSKPVSQDQLSDCLDTVSLLDAKIISSQRIMPPRCREGLGFLSSSRKLSATHMGWGFGVGSQIDP